MDRTLQATELIGRPLVSDWITINQERITTFGNTTEDLDPTHIDPAWCQQHSPWGKPIAFGFLTMSMLARLWYDVAGYPLDADPEAEGYPANYGFNRLRLIAPVAVDSRIRGHFTVTQVAERKPGQTLITIQAEVEIEGHNKPALVAEWLSMWIAPTARRT